jgi:hypothetical protein
MIPCTDNDGLRDYRESLVGPTSDARPRWPWLVLVAIAFLVGLAIGELR